MSEESEAARQSLGPDRASIGLVRLAVVPLNIGINAAGVWGTGNTGTGGETTVDW